MKNKISIIFLIIAVSCFAKDKGKGLLYIIKNEKKVEIKIYERSNSNSKMLAVFTYENKGNGEIVYEINSERLVEENLIEFEYEEQGIPLCRKYKNWLKVIYGFEKNGKKLVGWIKYEKQKINYFFWSEHLKSKLLFFESSDKINLYDAINGNEVSFKLEPSPYLKYDYIMKPLETKGKWMKVELTTPNDNCDIPNHKRKGVFWIRYLDDKFSPKVWYFTRGC
ncbi:MAG: hypothetical protein GKR88_21125 [Flavobacteriaceae bacterium]|nr:MAG: hypothetical protein GKR88_21125 [Flavobacteriaceae bacterium]